MMLYELVIYCIFVIISYYATSLLLCNFISIMQLHFFVIISYYATSVAEKYDTVCYNMISHCLTDIVGIKLIKWS